MLDAQNADKETAWQHGEKPREPRSKVRKTERDRMRDRGREETKREKRRLSRKSGAENERGPTLDKTEHSDQTRDGGSVSRKPDKKEKTPTRTPAEEQDEKHKRKT